MNTISEKSSTGEIASNDSNVNDVVIQALNPFSENCSSDQVVVMSDSHEEHLPTIICRKITIQQSSVDQTFFRHICESTGKVIWMPSGDYVLADRPSKLQPQPALMNLVLPQEGKVVKPESYEIHHTDGNIFGENENILRPNDTCDSMMIKVDTIRLHQHIHPISPKPRPSETGNRRNVARPKQQKRLQEFRHRRRSPHPDPNISGEIRNIRRSRNNHNSMMKKVDATRLYQRSHSIHSKLAPRRKQREHSRKSRKHSRESREYSRKSRDHSRKSRKYSRESREYSRESREHSRKPRRHSQSPDGYISDANENIRRSRNYYDSMMQKVDTIQLHQLSYQIYRELVARREHSRELRCHSPSPDRHISGANEVIRRSRNYYNDMMEHVDTTQLHQHSHPIYPELVARREHSRELRRHSESPDGYTSGMNENIRRSRNYYDSVMQNVDTIQLHQHSYPIYPIYPELILRRQPHYHSPSPDRYISGANEIIRRSRNYYDDMMEHVDTTQLHQHSHPIYPELVARREHSREPRRHSRSLDGYISGANENIRRSRNYYDSMMQNVDTIQLHQHSYPIYPELVLRRQPHYHSPSPDRYISRANEIIRRSRNYYDDMMEHIDTTQLHQHSHPIYPELVARREQRERSPEPRCHSSSPDRYFSGANEIIRRSRNYYDGMMEHVDTTQLHQRSPPIYPELVPRREQRKRSREPRSHSPSPDRYISGANEIIRRSRNDHDSMMKHVDTTQLHQHSDPMYPDLVLRRERQKRLEELRRRPRPPPDHKISGEKENMERPKKDYDNTMIKMDTTTMHPDEQPILREPAAAETDSGRTVPRKKLSKKSEQRRRRRRRRRCRLLGLCPPSSTAKTVASPIVSALVMEENNNIDRGFDNKMEEKDNVEIIVGRTKNGSSITIYKSRSSGHDVSGEEASQITTIDLSGD